MANDDFFNEVEQSLEPQVEEQSPEEAPSKLRIGEDEFDPQEAQELIKLGRIGKEAQDKYNTDLTKVYPAFTKVTQELAELRKTQEQAQIDQKVAAGQELSPEEQERQVRDTLRKYGVVFQEELDQRVDGRVGEREATKQLLTNVETVVADARDKYGINTDARQLLTFMQGRDGDLTPDEAFKQLFEPQIKQWEEDQLKRSRPQGLVTDGSSTAGSKQPAQERPTRQNLQDLVLAELGGE